jgi:CheY-like chemotaxis protein
MDTRLAGSPPPPPTRCTVLLVDDHAGTREMLGVALEVLGFKSRTAENGLEALESLAGNACQVVLSDLWMPEMNGAELLTAVRGNHDFDHIPVIIMTAAYEALPAAITGADAFLRKPFDSQALLAALAKVRCTPSQ